MSDSSFPSHPRSVNPHPICLSPIGSHSKSRQPGAPTDAPAATPHHCSRRSLHAATRWPTAPPPAPATGARVPLAREPSVRQVPDRQIAEARFCSGRSRPALASACSRLLWPRLRSAPPTPGCSPPLPSGPHVWLVAHGRLLASTMPLGGDGDGDGSGRVPVEPSVREHAGAARSELACVRSRSPAPTPKPWAVPTAPSLRGWAERFPVRLVSGCAPAACSQRASDRAPPRAPR